MGQSLHSIGPPRVHIYLTADSPGKIQWDTVVANP
jgi:hypothetical protein